MRRNNKLIVVISTIALILVASAVFAYLFLMTDIFKSNKELFAKYLSKNEEIFQKIFNLQTIEIYEKLENENKYELNTNIKMVHSEGGEISNPLNNLNAKLDIQKNKEQQYVYAAGQILYEDETYLETEIIKEQELYGIRFSNMVKQFVTIDKNKNNQEIANDIGIDNAILEKIIDVIDGTEQKTTEEQETVLKDKYLNIITKTIDNGIFEKQSNAMITYNNITTETNAYSVLLSNENVRNMLIEILNNLKTETQILENLQEIIDKEEITKKIDNIIKQINEEIQVPEIKITVFEQKQKTIRTDIEIGSHKITIENTEQAADTKTKINYLNSNRDEVKKYDFEISKGNTKDQENFEIVMTGVEGEEEYEISYSSLMQVIDDEIELELEVNSRQGITIEGIVIENKITIGKDFEKTQSLDSENNVLLNNIEEQNRREIINYLKEAIPQKTNEKIDLLKIKLGLKEEETQNAERGNELTGNSETEPEMSQVEINKFNAKFEFYTGDEVSAENVKTLLDVVKNNLKNYENIEDKTQNNEETINSKETKINIRLNIEKETINEQAINEVLGKINNNKKYKVLIHYKETNNLIDYITIVEV